ncbi:hypothetical protein [Microbacterium sp. 2FI]|uniref:hypothetical protein n=1 Tax=Microbacterium sp. 2FI TaxID=2502193 RepID=UPI0010F8DA07|nr:hypothetical protein [Microbacterium sp. 2FI]
MRLVAVATVSLTVAVLAGCAASEPRHPAAFDIAWDNCTSAYQELAKTGAYAERPCENWIDSQGRDEFAEFWSNPDEFIAFVVSEAKLGALEAHTR